MSWQMMLALASFRTPPEFPCALNAGWAIRHLPPSSGYAEEKFPKNRTCCAEQK
jgi:hypothetical protein